MKLATVTLYVRPGCELCVDSEAILRTLMAGHDDDLRLRIVNIEQDPALHARLLEQIPAIEVAGQLLPLALRRAQIAAHLRLAAELDHGER
jgi:glutaredoxin